MRNTTAKQGRHNRLIRLIRLSAVILGGSVFLWLANDITVQAKEKTDTCVTCHSDEKFMVRNIKLYEYFQNWQLSLHRIEGVNCVDCHGGNPKAKTKENAHGGKAMGAAEKSSPISYQNIPKTCAKCHDEVFERFRKSEHYKHLISNGQTEQGPNCVTCHGSVNLHVLNVNSVQQVCTQCHNEKTRNNPDIPEQAERVLRDFLSIDRYTRYLTLRGDPKKVQPVLQDLEPKISELGAQWHTFDLDAIHEETHQVLKEVKEKRKELIQLGKNR